MKDYLKIWDFSRILRLALGLFIIAQSIVTKEWVFMVLGVWFSLLPIFNIACCGATGCKPTVRNNSRDIEDINYEEVR